MRNYKKYIVIFVIIGKKESNKERPKNEQAKQNPKSGQEKKN